MAAPRIAVYTATRNYYEYLVPAVTSLLVNTPVDKVYLLIEDRLFPYGFPDKVVPMNVKRQKFFNKDGPNFGCSWTYMVMMKVALPKLFPDLDRVLMLDVDTIVDADISEIWDTPLNGHYLAAVREVGKTWLDDPYYNAGVMLMDLKRMRDSGVCDRIIDALNTKEYYVVEQDCINEMCVGKVWDLPGDYNVSEFTVKPTRSPKIIHYAGKRKWDDEPLYLKYLELYRSGVDIWT